MSIPLRLKYDSISAKDASSHTPNTNPAARLIPASWQNSSRHFAGYEPCVLMCRHSSYPQQKRTCACVQHRASEKVTNIFYSKSTQKKRHQQFWSTHSTALTYASLLWECNNACLIVYVYVYANCHKIWNMSAHNKRQNSGAKYSTSVTVFGVHAAETSTAFWRQLINRNANDAFTDLLAHPSVRVSQKPLLQHTLFSSSLISFTYLMLDSERTRFSATTLKKASSLLRSLKNSTASCTFNRRPPTEHSLFHWNYNSVESPPNGSEKWYSQYTNTSSRVVYTGERSFSRVNRNVTFLWEWSKFDSSQNPNPSTDCNNILHN